MSNERADFAAKHRETPTGLVHLHFIMCRLVGLWVVRTKGSPLCNTRRCRRVYILEEAEE